MNRQRFINNVQVERSENKIDKYQKMTSEEIYEELKKLPSLIKDQAGKKASEKTMTTTMIHHHEAIAQIKRKNLINDPPRILERPKINPNHLDQEKI